MTGSFRNALACSLLVALYFGAFSSALSAWMPSSTVLTTAYWPAPNGERLTRQPGTVRISESFDFAPTIPDNPVATVLATATTKLAPPTVVLDNDVSYSHSSTGGSLRYYFSVDDTYGIFPSDYRVPVVFASKAHVMAGPVRAPSGALGAHAHASASLAIGYGSLTQGDKLIGTVDQINALADVSDDKEVDESKLFFRIHEFTPAGYGWAQITAVANVGSAGLGNVYKGTAYAYIDPYIYIDPNFMVEHEGQMVPGSELFQLTFSEGIVNVPEPATVGLAAWAVAAILTLSPVRSRSLRLSC